MICFLSGGLERTSLEDGETQLEADLLREEAGLGCQTLDLSGYNLNSMAAASSPFAALVCSDQCRLPRSISFRLILTALGSWRFPPSETVCSKMRVTW